ncbi:OmpA family protein [Dechloromonas sp. XY25]|uniref:OmpA family protein n=1 Tax=Dechloromonas hankyongensis TaxID=2908002 RepID=A0ABS9K5X0_9RHOO|nr:OmpA family protein [Dechloromonas hankyongensis]MCG2578567.1 OmpA family protein [Dechloromonas hankyongensis]
MLLSLALALLSACSGVPRNTGPEVSLPATTDQQPPAVATLPDEKETAESPPGPTDDSSPIAEGTAKEQSSERNIYFPVGNAHIALSGLQKLERHALYLRQNPKRTVTLIGHSESFGSRNYTLAIMEKRLATVAAKLHELGVEKSRIRQIIFGSQGNQRSCTAAICRQRVEIQFH